MDDKNISHVRNIITHVKKVLAYCDGMDANTFVSDNKTVDACLINLQQIGELTNRMDEQFKEAHKDIPWNKMRGLRNVIAHDYYGVNEHQIWKTINNDLPDLIRQLNKLAPKTT